MSSKVLYLESPTLICLFTMQLLWGYDDIRVPPLLSIFGKKNCPGINRGLELN